MSGGTLDLRGEVKGFHHSTFSTTNKGTVIWKGVTLWKDGEPTPEYTEMKAKREIPITN